MGQINTNRFTNKILGLLMAFGFVGSSALAQDTTNQTLKKALKVQDLQFVSDYEPDLVKVKKKNKWGVYSIDTYSGLKNATFKEILPIVFDSLGSIYEPEVTVAIYKGKYGFLPNPFNNDVYIKKLSFHYNLIVTDSVNGNSYNYFKMGNKWGLLHQTGYEMIPAIFSKKSEVPKLWLSEWYIDQHKAIRKKLEADLVIPDGGNGDGVFKYRDSETQKWGMVQYFGKNQYTKMIPAEFDSVRFFPFNSNYTAVYNNGKVGIYLASWSYNDRDTMHTVPCVYEDYKRYTADGVPKLAMKKDGKWGWVNWLTGKPMSEFNYETTDDLPYPHYKQRLY